MSSNNRLPKPPNLFEPIYSNRVDSRKTNIVIEDFINCCNYLECFMKLRLMPTYFICIERFIDHLNKIIDIATNQK